MHITKYEINKIGNDISKYKFWFGLFNNLCPLWSNIIVGVFFTNVFVLDDTVEVLLLVFGDGNCFVSLRGEFFFFLENIFFDTLFNDATLEFDCPGAPEIFDIAPFNNNLPKTMSQKYDRSVDVRRLNPGPGYYNHITNFGRIYF